MRYLWPVLIVLFVLFSIDFATQNPEVVVVKYSLEWLNYGIRSERPLFVTLYLTLALGILFSVLYFLVYHTKLLAQMRKLRGEIKKLQKQLEAEKEKNKIPESGSSSLTAYDTTSIQEASEPTPGLIDQRERDEIEYKDKKSKPIKN